MQTVDILAIQRSLTILEDRYRELREIGKKHQQAWKVEVTTLRENNTDVREEKEGLEKQLGDVRGEKEGLEKQLGEAREECELLLLQLHQVQEELEHYFLEANQFKSDLETLGIKKRLEREEKESLALQLHHKSILLDTLEYECRLKDEKLAWLRSQRQLLIDLVKYQFNVFGRFADLNLRFKWSKNSGQTRQLGGLAGLQGIIASRSPKKPSKVNKQVQ